MLNRGVGVNPKIGLLPLYIELYDRTLPEIRAVCEGFCGTICEELRARGLEVIPSPTCRKRGELAEAIRRFEEERVDGLVTLHLAYSPSLESAALLERTKLPILALDTTPTYAFGPDQKQGEILYNHGIHGVQDMCNMLLRLGKAFRIEAGHWQKSDVLDRAAEWARGARLSRAMRSSRIGLIGEPFDGMGDFQVSDGALSGLGITVVRSDPAVLRRFSAEADSISMEEEMREDRERLTLLHVDQESHRRTTIACLAVRRWLEQERLTGFAMNFLDVGPASGLGTVPFLEASKAMARGLGYAGEGDVLTAALVGVLASLHPETTFTEMFCPDWEGGRIFLSHMGEMNLDLCAQKPLLTEKPFPWTDAEDPVIAFGRLKSGGAVLVDLAPGTAGSWSLVIAPGEVEGDFEADNFEETIRGWFRPRTPVADFLEAYSKAGGTHHLALVYGDVVEEVSCFGEIMGWNVVHLL
jgi:L-arabinose isomerase